MRHTSSTPGHGLTAESIKFISVGLLYTIVNYAVYLATLQVAPWWIAFFIALLVSIPIQIMLQIKSTFSTDLDAGNGVSYACYQLVYVAVFFVCLSGLVGLGVPESYAPLLLLIGITPVNFLLTRRLIRRRWLA